EDVELRRRGAPSEAAPPPSWTEADPPTLRSGARPDGQALRPDPADADVRRLLRASADVRGPPRLLLDDLQLEDRAAGARCLRLRAQSPDPREATGQVPALGPARQADAGALLRRALPGLRHRAVASGAGRTDAGRHERRRA